MLSDGEFVMTARAVRGAGNGSREKGVRKMYQMMRAFEGEPSDGRHRSELRGPSFDAD